MAELKMFRELDNFLKTNNSQPLLSLDPQKEFITSFHQLGSVLLEISEDEKLICFIAKEFHGVLEAQIVNFPENIFWDFDFLLGSLLNHALAKENSLEQYSYIKLFCRKTIQLLELFGCNSAIRFRYVHDFTYGFDWAKWVKKDEANRACITPFSMKFLESLIFRGKELLELIAADDEKYSRLRTQHYRNPFMFSREPGDEKVLMRRLAANNLIPVPLWKIKASPVWQKSFAETREALSIELGIESNT
ncbi:hypothetical protein R9C00_22015 [Flammeovirgaceae bacterium SG7u.111]|nr:hypothetical protein [Flammeovirgaceae bacterium SG7u.132]WPO34380.1 hypothetical protein R9C00_22015 [Flammeovirgaceae bacterium SG7u.111]